MGVSRRRLASARRLLQGTLADSNAQERNLSIRNDIRLEIRRNGCFAGVKTDQLESIVGVSIYAAHLRSTSLEWDYYFDAKCGVIKCWSNKMDGM